MTDDPYSTIIDILTLSVKEMGERGVTKSDLLPGLLDFTATIAVATAGEHGLEASIIRLKRRVDDYRNGRFPVDTTEEAVH